MSEDAAEDARLIEESLAGDERAFRQIIRKYQNGIFDLSLRMTGSRPDAEDIAQETFLRLYQHLGDYKKEHKLSNWIYTIALNRCRSLLRKRKVLRFLSLERLFASGDDDDRAPPEPVSSEPMPDSGLEKEASVALAQKMVDSLPDKLREPFILRHIKHLSYKEISKILHLSMASVKVRLHRAKSFLWKKFGKL